MKKIAITHLLVGLHLFRVQLCESACVAIVAALTGEMATICLVRTWLLVHHEVWLGLPHHAHVTPDSEGWPHHAHVTPHSEGWPHHAHVTPHSEGWPHHAHVTPDRDKPCCYGWFVCHDEILNQPCAAHSGSPHDDEPFE